VATRPRAPAPTLCQDRAGTDRRRAIAARAAHRGGRVPPDHHRPPIPSIPGPARSSPTATSAHGTPSTGTGPRPRSSTGTQPNPSTRSTTSPQPPGPSFPSPRPTNSGKQASSPYPTCRPDFACSWTPTDSPIDRRSCRPCSAPNSGTWNASNTGPADAATSLEYLAGQLRMLDDLSTELATTSNTTLAHSGHVHTSRLARTHERALLPKRVRGPIPRGCGEHGSPRIRRCLRARLSRCRSAPDSG
jgi:hypothetical protein